LSPDKWLIELNCLGIILIHHKVAMGKIKFPDLVLASILCGLPEDPLDIGIVTLVPVDFGLHHEDWDVLV
jgi:hypothetical protein